MKALLGLVCLAVVMSPALQAAGNEGKEAITFLSVAPDEDYEGADAMLADYLQQRTKITFSRTKPIDYHKAIEEVVRRRSPYVARLTPYACVVAELQGAKFDILATYASRATKTPESPAALTYHSYFVVNTSRPGFTFSANPGLREIDDFLRSGPRTFLYHDKFSTSSYFIPLNHFRSQRAYHLEKGQPRGRLTPLETLPAEPGRGSSDSVRDVLAGKADIAAVWDGTKRKFESQPSPLRFVRIDQALPNDLLVVSNALPPEQLESLRRAIETMPCGKIVFPGDFECWYTMDKAREAREALADLRRLAVAPPAPVTVRISLAEGAQASDNAYLEAARQAVRLAGTELVLYDPDFHHWADLDWKLETIHDGALKLTSIVNGIDESKVEKQTFRLSFADADEELTRRIVNVIHTRLHRIRYIWPFENRVPTVLRDVGFALPRGSRVQVQKIIWIDPERNDFTLGEDFGAEVVAADFNKFQLDDKPFPKRLNQELEVDPMSNAAFRVILVRPTAEKPLFQYLTLALVALFGLGGTAAAVDLYRARAKP